jgi:hypothetical protein
MLRLKLPRVPAPPPATLPPELWWDAPRPSALALLSRRQFLRAAAVALAALTLPLGRARRAGAAVRGRFLTRAERATLEALCDRILPPDRDPATGRPSPGAGALGAATYIERMLGAFDRRRPRIFAGGPFSGRQPFPNLARGAPSRRRPRNAFRRFLAPSRLQELRWRAELFGSAAVPGADFNDAALGPLKGLRDVYREGLARVDEIARAMAGAPFARLPVAEQDRVLALLDAPGAFPRDLRRDATFPDLLIQHTLEGCFAAPEYGGNRRLGGWKLAGLEGDSQPLGFSIFSRREDAYRERPEHPMSTPNPDEQGPDGTLRPRPLSADAARIQDLIVSFATTFEALDC